MGTVPEDLGRSQKVYGGEAEKRRDKIRGAILDEQRSQDWVLKGSVYAPSR